MERENFKSRLGFILISAGCAIGIGNVWKFPYVTGQNGGGIFVLFYLFFLIAVGVPVLTMEFAIGRASRKSPVCCYQELEKPGSKWHLHGYAAMFGNYVLMMFYTSVAGWMLCYFFKFLKNDFAGLNTEAVAGEFSKMLGNPVSLTFWMGIIVVVGFLILFYGTSGRCRANYKSNDAGTFGIDCDSGSQQHCPGRRYGGSEILFDSRLEQSKRSRPDECNYSGYESVIFYS